MAGIYIHIPFCKKKCIYCDFFSVASSPEKIADYAECLKKEYACRAKELGCGKVSTVYFGGGTPSLLPPRVVEELLGCLTGVVPEAEISFEMNPDDVTDAYAESLRHIGVNRISMGVQSFSDKELAFLNRRHDAQQAERAVGILRRAGFENISIDLIYGIPGQTLDSWRASLQKAVSLSLPHLSTYCLMYEEGTRMTRMRNRGDFEVCADDLCVVMYEELASVAADSGYEQYEISNFSKPGMHSRHNSSYWDFTPYLGLGASAHSFDGTVRRFNPSDLRRYMSDVRRCGSAYTEESETLSELYNEWVMTRLRTKWGLDLQELAGRFGKRYSDVAVPVIAAYETSGCLCREADTVRLTRKGVMLSDAIFRDLFVVD